MTSYTFHAEHAGLVEAREGELFALLDDHSRLSAHMMRRSWKMGWGKMSVTTDTGRGREVGSHIQLSGRALGIRIELDEVVDERHSPVRKSWETVGEPRLIVIGAYRMGFEIRPSPPHCTLCVWIDYEWPARGISRLLGRMMARGYANWCVQRMVLDAQHSFEHGVVRASPASAAVH